MRLALVLVLLLAGCASPFSGTERTVRTRSFTIVTDVAATASPGIAEVASFLDLAAERLCAQLGRPCPEDGSLRVRLFSRRSDFEALLPDGAELGGYYDRRTREVVLPLGAHEWFELPESERKAWRGSKAEPVYERADDAHVLLHELTHQLLHDELASSPQWLCEGLAELHPARALRREDGFPSSELVRSFHRHDREDALVLVCALACQGRLFVDRNVARLRSSSYLVFLGVATYLVDRDPSLLERLRRGFGGTLPDGLEESIARWSRLETTRSLVEEKQTREPAFRSLLGLLWDHEPGERELRAAVADEGERLRTGRPAVTPALLRDRPALREDPDPILRAAVAAQDPDLVVELDRRSSE